jgi:hypothetical protein
VKTYNELTDEQKASALRKATDSLLKAIVEGRIWLDDDLNHDDLQARIDAAMAKCERLKTPWFAAECIMETCKDDIEGMALCDAQDALYVEPGEIVIRGIATP